MVGYCNVYFIDRAAIFTHAARVMSTPHKFLSAAERLARNLRQIRAKRGISQEALAIQCGLSRVFLSRVENGTDTVSLANIERLADALKVDLVDLLLP